MLATMVELSPSRLSHVFKATVGMSLRRYMQVARLRQAARLLVTTDARVSEVADQAGYTRVADFDHAFIELYGSPPSVFRVTARRKLGSESH
jgi:AraC-like DNA-binding protein